MNRSESKWFGVLTAVVIAVGTFSWAPGVYAVDSLLVAQVPEGEGPLQILRYNGETGEFVDVFIPEGTGGLILACCMTWGPDQNLYVGDPFNRRVLKFSPTGAFLGEFFPSGSGGMGLGPLGVIFGPDGNFYAGDFEHGSILRYDGATGAFIDEFVPPGGGGLQPWGQQFMVFGPDGNLYLSANQGVLRFEGATGAFLDTFATTSVLVPWASGLAFGEDGNLYVTNDPDDSIERFDGTTGALIDHFVQSGSGGLSAPVGLAFGPDDNLYVADYLTDRVLRFDGTSGAFIDDFATDVLGPRGIVFSPKFDVCHRNRFRGGKTLSIGHLGVDDHIRHGDSLGACRGGTRLGRQVVLQ